MNGIGRYCQVYKDLFLLLQNVHKLCYVSIELYIDSIYIYSQTRPLLCKYN